MVATETDDLRCSSLIFGSQIEVEEPRYKSLHRLVDLEVEDSRCNSAAVAMEDPRCQCLSSKW
jgi:hypothetical protein